VIWTEHTIGRALCRQTFNRSALVLVPNCNWTGYECDVLIVEKNLRIIDIEVKISRADLKADAKKDKWWSHMLYSEALAAGKTVAGERWDPYAHRQPVAWPRKVWKHYYAMPKAIWAPELIDFLPANSGILLLSEPGEHDTVPVVIRCVRPLKPNRDAAKLEPAAVLDIARLANLRMWEAYAKLEAKP
jgi:hypothetical protein